MDNCLICGEDRSLHDDHEFRNQDERDEFLSRVASALDKAHASGKIGNAVVVSADSEERTITLGFARFPSAVTIFECVQYGPEADLPLFPKESHEQ